MWTYFCLLCASISLLFISLGSFSNFPRTMSQTPVVVVTTRCQLTARRVVLLRQLIEILVWLIECGLFHCFYRNVILFFHFCVMLVYNTLTVQLHDWQSCLILKSYFACPTVLLSQKFVYLHVTLFSNDRSYLLTYLLTELYGRLSWLMSAFERTLK